MAQITIYRIENENGLGLYQGNMFGLLGEMKCKHNSSSKHPGVWDFGLIQCDFDPSLIFGFQTLEQLKSWFDSYIPQLEVYGYKIVQFQIDESKIIVGKSGRQIIFRRKDVEMK